MATTNSLQNFGFQPATTEVMKRLIVAIDGHRGRGKTHQALMAPGPIAYFNLDIGLMGVSSKFADKKVIMVNDIQVPPDQADAEKEWNRFYAAWQVALKAKDIRTVVIDTESQLWELFRLNKFGQLTQIMPYQYAQPNAIYARFLRETMTVEKNFIFLRHLKPLYINDKRTKDYEASGFGGLEKIVEVVAEVWRTDLEDGGEWKLTVTKNRLNPDMDGETLSGEMASFKWLAAMSVAGTSVEDWE